MHAAACSTLCNSIPLFFFDFGSGSFSILQSQIKLSLSLNQHACFQHKRCYFLIASGQAILMMYSRKQQGKTDSYFMCLYWTAMCIMQVSSGTLCMDL